MVQAKTTLSSKGQVVIPKALRDKLGLHSGIEFIIHINSTKMIELQPIKKDISHFFGMGLKNKVNPHSNYEDDDILIGKAVLQNDRN